MTALGLVNPDLLRLVIDRVIIEGEYQWLPHLSLAVVGVAILRAVFQYGRSYIGHVFGANSVYELRNHLYERLQSLSFSYYDRARTGDLMSRLAGDTEVLRQFLSFGFAHLLQFIFLFLFGLVRMLMIDWQLTLWALITMPFLSFMAARFHVQVHPAFVRLRESLADMSSVVQESITGIRTVKSFNQEARQVDIFEGKVNGYIGRHMAAVRIWTRYFPSMELMGNISVLILLFVGGRRVMAGALSLGDLAAMLTLIWFLVEPLQQLGYQINNLTQSLAAGGRILEVMRTRRDVRSRSNADALMQVRGHVRFEGVSFTYRGTKTPALADIDLDVPPGTVVGILGPSGAGKSTLVSLIPRFYDVSAGRVTIDGVDVRDVGLESLRQQVGVVFQETFLFSTTLRENIAFARREASFEEIVAAAKRAKAHEFIMELPQGYDTLVGERGMGLSGGQKQRIAIARALLADPRILILDDATAAVDMETEHEIQQALRELMRGRTTFIIAHRISSVKDADQIIVLDGGRIVESGNHESLQALGGAYKRICDVQLYDHASIARSLAEASLAGGLQRAVGLEPDNVPGEDVPRERHAEGHEGEARGDESAAALEKDVPDDSSGTRRGSGA